MRNNLTSTLVATLLSGSLTFSFAQTKPAAVTVPESITKVSTVEGIT